MIRYNLRCEKGHAFESWFANSAAYDKQAARGLIGNHGSATPVGDDHAAGQLFKHCRQLVDRHRGRGGNGTAKR